MDLEIKRYIEYRLTEWAHWYTEQLPRLGYPTQSTESRLMTYGAVRIQSGPSTMERDHPRAETIDSLLNDLARFDENTAKVIKTHYTYSGTQKDKAQYLNMAVTQYKVYLNMATSFLAGVLKDHYQTS